MNSTTTLDIVVCYFVCLYSFPQSEKEKEAEEVEFQFMLRQMTERKKRKHLVSCCVYVYSGSFIANV